MPRGTRAVHDNDGAMTGVAGVEATIMTEWSIDVSCWCEQYVVRIPYQVWRKHCITGSCGAEECNNPYPGGFNARVFDIVSQSKTKAEPFLFELPDMYSRPPLRMLRNADRESRQGEPELRAGVRRCYRRHETSSMPVDVRRDMVRVMWSENKRKIDIADELGVPVHTVNNDLMWLKRRDNRKRRRP